MPPPKSPSRRHRSTSRPKKRSSSRPAPPATVYLSYDIPSHGPALSMTSILRAVSDLLPNGFVTTIFTLLLLSTLLQGNYLSTVLLAIALALHWDVIDSDVMSELPRPVDLRIRRTRAYSVLILSVLFMERLATCGFSRLEVYPYLVMVLIMMPELPMYVLRRTLTGTLTTVHKVFYWLAVLLFSGIIGPRFAVGVAVVQAVAKMCFGKIEIKDDAPALEPEGLMRRLSVGYVLPVSWAGEEGAVFPHYFDNWYLNKLTDAGFWILNLFLEFWYFGGHFTIRTAGLFVILVFAYLFIGLFQTFVVPAIQGIIETLLNPASIFTREFFVQQKAMVVYQLVFWPRLFWYLSQHILSPVIDFFDCLFPGFKTLLFTPLGGDSSSAVSEAASNVTSLVSVASAAASSRVTSMGSAWIPSQSQVREIKRHSDDVHALTRLISGYISSFQSAASVAEQKATGAPKHMYDQVGQKVKKGAKQAFDCVEEKAEDAAHQAKEKAGWGWARATDKVEHAKENAEDKTHQAKEKAGWSWARATDQVEHARENVEGKAKELYEKAEDKVHQAKEKAGRGWGRASEKVEHAKDKVESKLGHGAHDVQRFMDLIKKAGGDYSSPAAKEAREIYERRRKALRDAGKDKTGWRMGLPIMGAVAAGMAALAGLLNWGGLLEGVGNPLGW